MAEVRIEETPEFEFIRKLIGNYENPPPTTTSEILRYFSYGIGIFQGVLAQTFIGEVRNNILSGSKHLMKVIPLKEERPLRLDDESKKIASEYINFNPAVVSSHVEREENNVSLHNLLREDTSAKDIEQIVSRAESWRDFFFRAKKEFGDEIGGGWGFDYPLSVESMALRANPFLERDYKSNGIGQEIYRIEGEYVGLSVPFKRPELFMGDLGIIINIDEALATSLVGKNIEYHINYMPRDAFVYLGNLVRIP